MPGFRLGSAKPSNNFPAQSGKPIPHAGGIPTLILVHHGREIARNGSAAADGVKV
jgi:hypothetical protein